MTAPRLIGVHGASNLVAWDGRVWLVPQALGPTEIDQPIHRARPGITAYPGEAAARQSAPAPASAPPGPPPTGGRQGKRDAPAVFYADDGDFVSKGPPGAFRWTGLYGIDEGGPYGLNFKCPCGCGAVHGAGFTTRPKDWNGGKDPRWTWDGNKERPTLSPSLGLHKSHKGQSIGADGYHWHGHLKAGVFEEC